MVVLFIILFEVVLTDLRVHEILIWSKGRTYPKVQISSLTLISAAFASGGAFHVNRKPFSLCFVQSVLFASSPPMKLTARLLTFPTEGFISRETVLSAPVPRFVCALTVKSYLLPQGSFRSRFVSEVIFLMVLKLYR